MSPGTAGDVYPPAGESPCGVGSLIHPQKTVRAHVCVLCGVNKSNRPSIRAFRGRRCCFSEFSLTKLCSLWQPPQQQSPRSLIYHKELMKRTLGRPTYAFEARQYVVSVCVMGTSTSGVPGFRNVSEGVVWHHAECVRTCVIGKSHVQHTH